MRHQSYPPVRPSYRVKIRPAVQAGWHCCWATAGRVAICQGRPTEPLVCFVQTGLVAELVADEGNTRKKDSGNPPRARVAVLSCCRPTEPLVSFVQTGLVAELVADEGNTRKKDSGNPPRARVAVPSRR
ncbi:hypothetical protein Droror1_Dr00016292 [Drosera rotundifolia]